MKLMTMLISAILLSGCGYDYNEITNAKAACESYKGQFIIVSTGDLVTSTKCTVDGITYRIGRTRYQLLEGYTK